MKYKKQLAENRGFTLIELMTVISILVLMSSIVLASIKNAQVKSKDTSIVQSMKQFEYLLNLEFSASRSFAAMQPGVWLTPATCDSYFSGTYMTNARSQCKSLLNNVPTSGTMLFVGNNISTVTTYSINALNNNGTYSCLGPSGYTASCGTLNCTGCFYNP